MKKILLLTFLISFFALSQDFVIFKFDTAKAHTVGGMAVFKMRVRADSAWIFLQPIARAYTNAKLSLLNGLSDSAQVLAIDTTGTGVPSWASAALTHTLNLPFARMKQISWTTGLQDTLNDRYRRGDTTSILASKSFVANTYVPLARTLTITGNAPLSFSGGTQTLASNRTWTGSLDTSTRYTGLVTDYRRVQDSLLFHLKVSPQNVKFVSPSFSTLVDPFYSSIQSAIDASSYGGTVLVYPATYSEYIQFGVDDSGKVLMGLDRYNTVIDSIYVQGKDVTVKNLTVNGTGKIICTATYVNTLHKKNLFKDLILNGNIFFGDFTDSTIYYTEFDNCQMYADTGRMFVVNYSRTSDRLRIYRSAGININYYAVRGRLDFVYCHPIVLDTLRYVTPNVSTNLVFEESESRIADSLITLSTNTTDWHILAIRGGNTGNFPASTGVTNRIWQFDGKFELDIMSCRFYYPNIVFNSTVTSRFLNVMGHGWANPNTITGTGLSLLYIYNSQFRTSPPSGLGGDVGNVWYATTDN